MKYCIMNKPIEPISPAGIHEKGFELVIGINCLTALVEKLLAAWKKVTEVILTSIYFLALAAITV